MAQSPVRTAPGLTAPLSPRLPVLPGTRHRLRSAPILPIAGRGPPHLEAARQSPYELVGISSQLSFSRLAPAVDHSLNGLSNFTPRPHRPDLYFGLRPACHFTYVFDRQVLTIQHYQNHPVFWGYRAEDLVRQIRRYDAPLKKIIRQRRARQSGLQPVLFSVGQVRRVELGVSFCLPYLVEASVGGDSGNPAFK